MQTDSHLPAFLLFSLISGYAYAVAIIGTGTAAIPQNIVALVSNDPFWPFRPLSSPTAAVVQSRSTGIVPTINGGSSVASITIPPTTTTLASSQATSSAVSVSSELAGLIPFIKSWKANPTPLKSDTLGKIKPVRNDVEDLISGLGGGPSPSGCDAKRRRGLLGALSDLVGGLSCIGQSLDSITDNINMNDVDSIDKSLDDLTSENDKLTKDNDDSNSNSNSASSVGTSLPSLSSSSLSPSSSSSVSSASCISTNTALHVTVQCVATSVSASGSTIPTTTCSPLTTVIVSGCVATTLTTTVLSSMSTKTRPPPCASDTCGDACPMNAGPLSGASMGIVASTEDCALISTITTSVLPTAIDAVASITAGPSKRSLPRVPVDDDNNPLDKRALPEINQPYWPYVGHLLPPWVSQRGLASAQWYDFPARDYRVVAGVNGLFGCTSVIIISDKGVYVSHIWENPVFEDANFIPTDDKVFLINAFNALRDGTLTAQSVTELIGTDQSPGVLNARYRPLAYVITPYTNNDERNDFGINTQFRFQIRAQQLAQGITQVLFDNSNDWQTMIVGYNRISKAASLSYPGTAGRAIVEVDPVQFVLKPDHGPGLPLPVGKWRLWVEDRLINEQTFVDPARLGQGGLKKRDNGYADPCASSSSSMTTSSVLDCMPVENPADEVGTDVVCSCPGGQYYSTLGNQISGDGVCYFATVTPASIPSAALIPSSTPASASAAPTPSLTNGPDNSPGSDPNELGGDLPIGPTTVGVLTGDSPPSPPTPTPHINGGYDVKPVGPNHDNT